MKIAQVAFFCAAVLKVSILVYPTREQIYIYYRLERSTKNQVLLSVVLTILVYMVPCVFPDIDAILDILGGLMLGTLGYSVPIALKLACLIRKKEPRWKIVVHFILLLLIVSVQIMATTLAIFWPHK